MRAIKIFLLLAFLLALPVSGMEYSVNVISLYQDNYTNADIPVSGTVAGNYTLTHASDNKYEAIEELAVTTGAPSGRKSYLEHKWTINLTSGNKTSVTFYLEANHTANLEGDDFVFAYSTNDINYYDMVTVAKTLDNNTYQTFEMPGTISSPVYIRVRDADRTPGNTVKDTIYIDHMFIRSLSDTTPPAKVANVTVISVSENTLNVSWKANTEADLDHYDVYRSTIKGFAPGAGSLIASPKINHYTDTGLTANTTYYYRVSAVDAAQNKGTPSDEAAGTTLRDSKGPAASNVLATPNPTGGAGTVALSASIDDSFTGNSTIAAAEYFVNTTGSNGTGTPMSASDGAFNSQFEKVTANINVSGWAPGYYTLYVHGNDSAGNWGAAASVVLEVTELATNTMHVHSIDMSLSTRTAGKNSFTYAEALVTIVDTSGAAVQGATVGGHWSSATSDTDSGITDATGRVLLSSDEVKNAPVGTTFTFTVDNAALAGWTYDASANVETSGSITVGATASAASSSSASGGIVQSFLDYVYGLFGGG